MIPVAYARELHGRERIQALREHFGWHVGRRDELSALLAEQEMLEELATVPMPFDAIVNSRPAPRWVPAWEVV
jgi:hypothetical protein